MHTAQTCLIFFKHVLGVSLLSPELTTPQRRPGKLECTKLVLPSIMNGLGMWLYVLVCNEWTGLGAFLVTSVGMRDRV